MSTAILEIRSEEWFEKTLRKLKSRGQGRPGAHLAAEAGKQNCIQLVYSLYFIGKVGNSYFLTC